MKNANWLKGAILLGIVFFLAIFIIKPIGVSTQFSVASGIVHNLIDPSIIQEDPESASGYSSTNAYYNKSGGSIAKSIKNPINYDFIFVLAIPIGALVGYVLDKKVKSKKEKKHGELIAKNHDMDLLPTTKKSFLRNYALTFLGGFLILFGARMADGCTSGHMMSGMMQGSVSGFIFAAAVFASAIPTAIITKKINIRKEG